MHLQCLPWVRHSHSSSFIPLVHRAWSRRLGPLLGDDKGQKCLTYCMRIHWETSIKLLLLKVNWCACFFLILWLLLFTLKATENRDQRKAASTRQGYWRFLSFIQIGLFFTQDKLLILGFCYPHLMDALKYFQIYKWLNADRSVGERQCVHNQYSPKKCYNYLNWLAVTLTWWWTLPPLSCNTSTNRSEWFVNSD